MATESVPNTRDKVWITSAGGVSPLQAMRDIAAQSMQKEEEEYRIPPGDIGSSMSALEAMSMFGTSMLPPTRQVRRKTMGFTSKEYARRKKKSRMAKASKRKNRKK